MYNPLTYDATTRRRDRRLMRIIAILSSSFLRKIAKNCVKLYCIGLAPQFWNASNHADLYLRYAGCRMGWPVLGRLRALHALHGRQMTWCIPVRFRVH